MSELGRELGRLLRESIRTTKTTARKTSSQEESQRWMKMTCDELESWIDDVFLDARESLRIAMREKTETARRLAERDLKNLEAFIKAIKLKRCMYP